MLQMLRESERVIARLREGLPRDAGDDSLVQPLADAETYQAEFVLPVRRRRRAVEAAAANGATRDEADGGNGGTSNNGGVSNSGAHGCGSTSRGASEERASAREGSADEGAVGGSAAGGGVGGGDKGDDGGDEGDGGEGGDGDGERRKVVAALAELDDSDAEPDHKSGSTYDEHGNRYPNKPLRLWRTARDRATWHKELRRVEMAESLSGALFCAAALLDRSQPLTIRLRNMARMAAERVAAAEAAAAAADGNDSDATLDGEDLGRGRRTRSANGHTHGAADAAHPPDRPASGQKRNRAEPAGDSRLAGLAAGDIGAPGTRPPSARVRTLRRSRSRVRVFLLLRTALSTSALHRTVCVNKSDAAHCCNMKN